MFYSHTVNNCYLQEAAIETKFTEVNAINKQRLQNLEFTQGLLNQVKCVLILLRKIIKIKIMKWLNSLLFHNGHISFSYSAT